MAHFVFQDMVNKLNIADQFHIDSKATSTEEEGNPPHYGTVNKLKEAGIPVLPHRASQIKAGDYQNYDYIIAMDENNLINLARILKGDKDSKIYKLLYFAGSEGDIADPWYTGDFDATYRDVTAGCKGLIEHLTQT